MENIIESSHLTKTYGKHRGVSDVSFTVREGEIFGFLGPNGAGKSTTIRSMLGLIKYQQGQITICGLDADAVTENLEDIVVFYEFTDDLYSDAQSLIEAYKEGYDLTEDGTLKTALVKAYVDNADSMDDSDYEEKLAEYAKAVALDSANEDALSGRKDCAYAVLDDMMSAQQYDEADKMIENLKEYYHHMVHFI